MIKDYKGVTPTIDKTAFIAETANIIGKVEIKENANIWYSATLRGDVSKIIIGKNSNIQDNACLHGDFTHDVIIEDNVTVGHNAVVHGATVKQGALIGMGSILLNGSIIEEGAVVAAGTVIGPGKVVPAHMIAMGNPMKIVKPVTEEFKTYTSKNKDLYVQLGKEHSE